jgi:glutaminyl-tRNA synthetase
MKNGAVHCTVHEDSKSGTPGADKYKVKGNIHWVSAKHAHTAEVRLYDQLFLKEHPEGLEDLNPSSYRTVTAQLEPALSNDKAMPVQFERHGYFVFDRGGFNRTVTLRDSWAK